MRVFDAWLNPKIPGNPWNAVETFIVHPKVDGLFYWALKGTFVTYSITVKSTSDLHVGVEVCRHRDTEIIWTGQGSGCSSFRSRQPTASPISRNESKGRIIGRLVSVERDHWLFRPLSVNGH